MIISMIGGRQIAFLPGKFVNDLEIMHSVEKKEEWLIVVHWACNKRL